MDAYIMFNNEVMKPKRKQVKIACSSCKASCKKCDEARPCIRCVSRGLGDTCRDSERKVRVKGTRRGPYRKANKKPQPWTHRPNQLPPISALLSLVDSSPSPNAFPMPNSLQAFSLNMSQQNLRLSYGAQPAQALPPIFSKRCNSNSLPPLHQLLHPKYC
ncbi:hypothetical protein L0F63_005440, partial [Massospora cicadina]